MFKDYYQRELTRLNDLGAEFANAHPAIAPLLSGHSADPDVERLLEGVAFITGQLRQKLDDEFPEIIHGLLQLIFPHYLRPVPSTTIMTFTPKPNLRDPYVVKAGTEIASVPVDGTQCTFRTCYPVDVHPVRLDRAEFETPSMGAPVIRLSMKSVGPPLSAWDVSSLRLHLAGDYGPAADLYHLLLGGVRRIVLRPASGGSPCTLPPEALRPVGFEDDESLFPYPPSSYPGYRLLQEYFVLPEKFLFLDLTGFERWTHRGDGTDFEILLELNDLPGAPPEIRKDSFVLFATPAVNLLRRIADPIRLDHRQPEYRIEPDVERKSHYQVYSVDRVVGIEQGAPREKVYVQVMRFAWHETGMASYHVLHRPSPIERSTDVFLSVSYPQDGPPPAPEVLSVELTCTNAALPERLNVGDISRPTSTSPEITTFRNIRMPTCAVDPPLGGMLLWRLLSHLSINQLPLEREENLRALLKLYIFPDNRDKANVYQCRRRVDGIQAVASESANRLVGGYMMRGREVEMTIAGDHYISRGDLYLFGSVLERFLGGYAGLNNYTRLKLHDVSTGDHYAWPARTGDRSLL